MYIGRDRDYRSKLERDNRIRGLGFSEERISYVNDKWISHGFPGVFGYDSNDRGEVDEENGHDERIEEKRIIK